MTQKTHDLLEQGMFAMATALLLVCGVVAATALPQRPSEMVLSATTELLLPTTAAQVQQP